MNAEVSDAVSDVSLKRRAWLRTDESIAAFATADRTVRIFLKLRGSTLCNLWFKQLFYHMYFFY